MNLKIGDEVLVRLVVSRLNNREDDGEDGSIQLMSPHQHNVGPYKLCVNVRPEDIIENMTLMARQMARFSPI